MPRTLSFYNWSLPKALAMLPDSFARAKTRIIFVILLFSVLKAIVVIYSSYTNEQWMQFARAVAAFVVYILLLKLVLSFPGAVKQLAHVMIIIGLLIIWSNILVFVHKANLPVLQICFMVILGSFYVIGKNAGFIYSTIAIVPIILSSWNRDFVFHSSAEELASPGFEIVNILNFITILAAHYFFYTAFDENLREKEALNKELRMSVSEAKKLAEARKEFVSTMSHELRTPLNSVIGITELLLSDSHSEKQKENLSILRYSAADLLSLVNNILDVNKLDSNKFQLEATAFNLCNLVSNVCSVLSLKAQEKNLYLEVECDHAIRALTVNSDPTRLSQVIYNLVGNAIRFTEYGGVTVQLRSLAISHDSARVSISVKDTGVGIEAHRQEAIFEPYIQAGNDTSRRYGGTGLGLTIVKQILALFGSSVKLESEPAKGSTFSFELAVKVAAPVEATSNDLPAQSQDISKLRILVAEDNEMNRLVLQKQLELLHLTAVMVPDGQKAYEAFVAADYDAVLLDLDMPGLDGYEAMRKMRSLHRPAKSSAHIIAFTASVTEQQFILQSGFDDYLYKPVNIKDLRTKLEKAVLPARKA